MKIAIDSTPSVSSARAARFMARQIRSNPSCVLGLATGSSPLAVYAELARMCRAGGISFAGTRTFNLDEYAGLPPGDARSYRRFMDENFFEKIDIDLSNTRVPNGAAPDLDAECAEYEAAVRAAGGIDLQLLGIGANGHIGFNEPSSSLGSRTRVVALSQKTLSANARFFGNDPGAVPKKALSMGIASILDAKKIVLLAYGKGKADAVAGMAEGPVCAKLPASALQLHPDVTVFLDEDAASKLELRPYYDAVARDIPA